MLPLRKYSTIDKDGTLIFHREDGTSQKTAYKALPPILKDEYPLLEDTESIENFQKQAQKYATGEWKKEYGSYEEGIPQPRSGVDRFVESTLQTFPYKPLTDVTDFGVRATEAAVKNVVPATGKVIEAVGETLGVPYLPEGGKYLQEKFSQKEQVDDEAAKLERQKMLVENTAKEFNKAPDAKSPTGMGGLGMPQESFGSGYDIQARGTREYYDSLARTQDKMAAKYSAGIQAYKDYTDKAQKEEFEKQQAIEDKMKAYEGKVNEYAAMDVSPDHFWKSRAGWQKAMAGIGMALGSMGQAFGQKDNKAVDIITDAIERDIDMQKFEISKKGNALSLERNVLNDMYNVFKDWRIAKKAAGIAMLEGVEREIKSIELNTQSERTRANATVALGQLKVKKDDQQMELLKIMAVMQTKGGNRDYLVPMPDGTYQEALTKKDAEDAKKFNASMGDIKSYVDELVDLRNKYGTEFFNRHAVNRAKAFSTGLTFKLKELYDLGILSKPDYEKLDGLIPTDPTSIGFVMDKLKAIQDQLGISQREFYKSRGLKPSDVTGYSTEFTD